MLSKIPKKLIWLTLKVIITVFCLWVLFVKIEVLSFEKIECLGSLGLVVLLVPINWLLESLKWKILISPFKKLFVFDAFRQIAKSMSIGLITPNRIGEVPARSIEFEVKERILVVAFSYIGSISQMFWIVGFGLLGLWRFRDLHHFENWQFNNWTLWLFMGLGLLVGSLVVFKSRWGQVQKFVFQIGQSVKRLTMVKFSLVHLLSLLRYCVYTIQFLLLLYSFDSSFQFFEVWLAISLVYLILAFSPFISFTELIIRSTISVFVLSSFIQSDTVILLSSTILWLLNVGLLSGIGLMYLWKTKN